MAFIKLLLVFYLFFLCCGAAGSFIVFVIDIFKFKDKEEKINVVPSNKESEVINDDGVVRDVTDNDSGSEREHNSSAVFDSWLQS